MKSRIVGTVSVIIIFVPMFIGCGNGSNKTGNTTIAKVVVQTAKVRRGEIYESITFSGRLEGEKDVMIMPQMPGEIERILVDVGDNVATGRLLVRMNATSLQQVEAQYNAARKTHERMKSLYEDSLVSSQSFDQAQAGYDAANAGYRKVLESTELRAPFAGTIVGKYFNEHDLYSPGLRGILRLAKTKKLKLPIQVAASDYPKLREGMEARITVEVMPDTVIIGELTNISPGADPITGLFSANIKINNPASKIPVGVFATAVVILSSKSDALIIPRSALIQDSTVFVYAGGKVERRTVSTGIVRHEDVEITDGLATGEVIVAEGALGLKNGMAVESVGKEVSQ